MAIETHQEYGVVTYDFVVAFKAYSIQTLDAPRFGNFHLELAFYGVIGTFIKGFWRALCREQFVWYGPFCTL